MRNPARFATITTGLAAVLSVLLLSPLAAGECSPGKIPVTMINPAGKVLELCIPENALPGLQQGATASGSELLEAQCPCFSQDDLDAVSPVTITHSSSSDYCINVTGFGASGEYLHASWDASTWAEPGEDPPLCVTGTWCEGPRGRFEAWIGNLSEDESLACTALLGSLASSAP